MTRTRNPNRLTKEEAIQFADEGKTLKDIALIKDCSEWTIREYYKKFNIKFFVAKRPEWTEERKKKHSQRFSGENNPFFGKTHNEKSRKQMSENHADFTGDKNPFRKSLEDPIKRQAHKIRTKEIWNSRDEEYRKDFGSKLSVAQANLIQNQSYKKHKHGHYLSKNGKSYFYRSSWEKRSLEYLDALYEDKKILNFDLEPFCIKYTHEGRKYALRVDFLIEMLDGSKTILECKPVGLRDYGRNPLKIKAYKRYCKRHKIKFILFGLDEIKTEETFWNAITRLE